MSKATGDEVLIRSDNCGFFQYGNEPDGTTDSMAFDAKSLNDTLSSAAYARACYGSDTSNILQCNQYAQPQLTYTVDQNASCPFAPGFCRHNLAYQMDSGHIDSHTALGINARTEDRITYRKLTTCAPIALANYTQVINGTQENGLIIGDVFISYLYGPIIFGAGNSVNFTYRFNTHTALDQIGYTLV